MFDDFLSEFITKKKLGTILINKGLVTEEQIGACLQQQQETREFLGEILLKRNLVTQNQLLESLAEQLELEYVTLDKIKVEINSLNPEVIDLVPFDFAVQHNVCLYKIDEVSKVLYILTANPMDMDIKDVIIKMTGSEVTMVVASREDVAKACELFKNLSLKILRKYFVSALNGSEKEVNVFIEKVDHPKYIPLLIQLLEKHKDAACRKEIALAIGRMNFRDKMIVESLNKILAAENDPVVKKAIEYSLKMVQ